MMKVVAAVVLAVVAVSIHFMGARFAPTEPNDREIPVVALRNWPPQYSMDGKTGKPAGFAIDMMNRVAASSDLRVRYVFFDDWPSAFEALERREVLVAPNLGIVEDRLDLCDFTLPYETFRIGIFVRRDAVHIRGEDDLRGRVVAVVRKNRGLALMRERGASILREFDSAEEAFMGLLSGNVEALVYPERPILEIAARSGLEDRIRRVGEPLEEIRRAVAVRKGEPELFRKLDDAVRRIVSSNEYREIYEKWYGRPEPFWTIRRVLVAAGILLGLTVAGMLGWRHFSVLRLNRSLAEAEERFREIVERAEAGYFSTDAEGRFLRVNRAWLEMHGYDSPDEVIGRPFSTTRVRDDSEGTGRDPEPPLPDRPVRNAEFAHRRRDGSVGYHTLSGHPVVRRGRSVGFEGFVIDAAERRRAEARVRQLHKAEGLGRMAGAIAHHFNNQLAVVMGNLELVLDDLDDLSEDDAHRVFLGEAMRAARRSSEISGLMLTYLGQGVGGSRPTDLSGTCRRYLPILRAAIPDGIRCRTDFMPSGPVVSADSGRLRIVLTHLVVNAAEAMGKGGGVLGIAAKTVARSDPGDMVVAPRDWEPPGDRFACLEVSDTGCGIDGPDMETLFDPFFTTKFTGRGLGLPVVLGLAKAWGGAVGVRSEKGRGSVFRVLLPLSEEAVADRAERRADARGVEAGGAVLLVDDQEMVRKMGEAMLARLGFSAMSAESGSEALELFRRHRDEIRCAITDLTMPDMDGWETLAALRKIRPDLPVVLASGYDEARAMDRAGSERPNAFLHKPYSREELKTALRCALGEDARADEGPGGA